MQRLEKGTTFTIQRIGEHQLNRKALLHEGAHEVTSDGRLRLVGVVGFQTAVGLEDLEEQGKGDRVEYAVGIHRDEAGLDCAEIADVLTGYVVGDGAVLLVTGFVDAQHKRPTA